MGERTRFDDLKASLRDGHVAAVERLLPEYVSRIDWPLARLHEERTVALRALLTTAMERSSWHRRRLEGIDVGSLSDRDIVDLPVMTKSDLMDNFDSIVTDPRLSDICVKATSPRSGGPSVGQVPVVASGARATSGMGRFSSSTIVTASRWNSGA